MGKLEHVPCNPRGKLKRTIQPQGLVETCSIHPQGHVETCSNLPQSFNSPQHRCFNSPLCVSCTYPHTGRIHVQKSMSYYAKSTLYHASILNLRQLLVNTQSYKEYNKIFLTSNIYFRPRKTNVHF